MACSSEDHSIDSPGSCFSACAGPATAAMVPLLGFPGTDAPPPPPPPPPPGKGPPLAPSGFPDGFALAPIRQKTSRKSPPFLKNSRWFRPIRTLFPPYESKGDEVRDPTTNPLRGRRRRRRNNCWMEGKRKMEKNRAFWDGPLAPLGLLGPVFRIGRSKF